jgi:hypothetical protein
MNILSLDLSTKTGWAYFEEGKLQECGTLFADKEPAKKDEWPWREGYPWDFIKRARDVVNRISTLFFQMSPDVIVIEETTGSSNNYSQKILEFIHHDLLMLLSMGTQKIKVDYVRTGVWRNIVQATQNDEEKKWNAKIGRIKKKTGKRLAKIDGKVVRKLDRKDYALRAFERHFNQKLDRKMNDACDAALVGLAYIKGCPVCDGTTTGGTLKDI